MDSKTSWSLRLSSQAEKDLAWFRKKNRKLYQKCFDLTLAVIKDPMTGIGKPESLKYLSGNVWSRRVSLEHRMVYEIFDNLVIVAAYRYHYKH
jgi:toxin YoeB